MGGGFLHGVSVGLLVLVAGMPATAHHSFAVAFDADKPLTLQGVITEVKWEAPHSWIYLDATDGTGKVVKWSLESHPPAMLSRTGVRPLLQAGAQVTVRGYHGRDPRRNIGMVREIVFATGQSFRIGNAPPLPSAKPNGNRPVGY